MKGRRRIPAYAHINVGALAVVWLVVFAADTFMVFGDLTSQSVVQPLWVRILKVLPAVLCAVLSQASGRDAWNDDDSRRLGIAFAAVVAADALFAALRVELGIAFFGLAHIVLIARHGTGLGAFLRSRRVASNHKDLYGAAIAIALISACFMAFVVHGFVGSTPLFFAMAVYALLLSASLWTAISSRHFGYLPSVNAKLAACSIALLYLCDMSVGLEIVLPHGRARLCLRALIYMFYIPCLFLLAVSGYSADGRARLLRPFGVRRRGRQEQAFD